MRMGIGLGVGINRSNYAQGIFNAYSARVVADGGVVESGSCVDAVSSLLQSASLLLIPSGYKGGKLYAEIPTNGNGDLTWTRGGDAFRTNASGVLQRVPWNLLKNSEAIGVSPWFNENLTISANSVIAPNGTTTADVLTETTATSSQFRTYQNAAQSTNIYTLSVYIKNITGTRQAYIDLGPAKGFFNFATETVYSALGIASFINVGNGWYRFSLTTANAITPSTIYMGLGQSNSETYTGNGTSAIAFWGAQLVEGTTAQTYLPTTDRLNFPRLSYMYGSCPALLLEPQRTNLALYSEQFNDATWIKSQSSITANQTTAPDGNTTADTFTGDGNLAQHFVYQNNSLTSGVVYTMSVYAKKNTNDFLQITAGSFLFGVNAFANFNLNNGTIGTVGSSATATITSIANGWYRCTMTATATTTGSGLSALYTLISSSTSARAEINSLATSLFLWGAQLEQGAYPTTYIPTTGSATATRVADSFSRSNIYTNGLISASGGTWFVELRNNVGYTRDAGVFGLFLANDINSNTGFRIKTTSGTLRRLNIFVVVNGSEGVTYLTTTDNVKIAIKWNGSTADVFVNGTKQVSATAFTETALEFLAHSTSVDVPKFIQQMALFPTPLSDTDCTTITTL